MVQQDVPPAALVLVDHDDLRRLPLVLRHIPRSPVDKLAVRTGRGGNNLTIDHEVHRRGAGCPSRHGWKPPPTSRLM